ncbi:MAG: tRNA (guanosine(46)-N7)-methyltransferase TrmB, partial [Bacteroidales bacterium]
VAFIRTAIDDIDFYFEKDEVSEIWITFPDPQPTKERKRLMSPHFVGKYTNFLKKNGIIHLKTDSRLLYEYTQSVIETEHWHLFDNIEHVYNQEENLLLTEIQTFYEKRWLNEGSLISYLSFSVK